MRYVLQPVQGCHPLAQAKKLTKKILASEKSVSDALAEF